LDEDCKGRYAHLIASRATTPGVSNAIAFNKDIIPADKEEEASVSNYQSTKVPIDPLLQVGQGEDESVYQ